MKKIADFKEENSCWKLQPKRCLHPEHNAPNMIVLEPGIYQHECPGCHEKQIVTIQPKYKFLHA